MAFSLGSFAGGLANGAEAGIGMADKLRQLNDAARVRAARSALGRSYASDIPMSDGSPTPPVTPPMPGVASVPATPPPTGIISDTFGPGAAQGSSFRGAISAPANDVSALQSGAPAPLPPPVAPPMPVPNMQPTPDAPATGTGGAPLSGTAASVAPPGADADPAAQLTSTITDANNTIKAIAHAIKQANPNIDPETLFEATNQHIQQMKGVRNEVKDYMTTQVEYAKIQQRMNGVIARVAGQKDVADTRAAAQQDVATTNAGARVKASENAAGARVKASENQAGARVTAAQIAAQGGVTRAQIASDTQRFVQDAHDKTRVYDTQLQTWAKVANTNTSSEAKVDAETARAGGTPPARQRLNPLPMPAAPNAAPSAPPRQLLKEGVNTTFQNGQTWTMRAGVPTRVK